MHFKEVIIKIGNIHKQLANMFFRRTLDSVTCNQTWHKVAKEVWNTNYSNKGPYMPFSKGKSRTTGQIQPNMTQSTVC